MQVKIKKLHPEAVMPTYGSSGAACFDLYSVDAWHVISENTFRTGLAFEIPDGHVMLVFGRSGHGFKHDTRLANCVGVIDHDYRGEVMVKMRCDSATGGMLVRHGERVTQAMVVPYPKVTFEWAEALTETERREGGFGSTGQ